jgi:hypothetical protein
MPGLAGSTLPDRVRGHWLMTVEFCRGVRPGWRQRQRDTDRLEACLVAGRVTRRRAGRNRIPVEGLVADCFCKLFPRNVLLQPWIRPRFSFCQVVIGERRQATV